MKLKILVKVEGEKIVLEDRFIDYFFSNKRYRQEAYVHDNKIYLFGGGGSSGVSFSLENVSLEKKNLIV